MIDRQDAIHRTVLDIDFFSKEKSHEMQERVSMLFSTKITPEIEKLLSEYAGEHEVMRIDGITVDIGKLTYHNLETELPSRIIDAMRVELDRLYSYKSGHKSKTGVEVIHSAEYYAECLEYYLTTGVLRWQDQKKQFTIEGILKELLEKHAQLLLKLLKRIGRNEHARKRIVYQFSEEHITRIIQVVSPANSKLIIGYLRKLEKVQQYQHIVKAEANRFKKAQYHFVLTYLFVERGSAFNTRSFLRSLIRQMASHYNMDYKQLLLTLIQGIRQQFKPAPQHGLLYFIREIFLEDHHLKAVSKPETSRVTATENSLSVLSTEQVSNEYLYYFLEKGFPPVQVKIPLSELAALFYKVLELSFPDFFKFSKKHNAASIAKNTIRFFEEKISEKIVRSYQPMEYTWTRSLQSGILLMQNHEVLKNVHDSLSFNPVVREAILYHVLILKNGVLNRPAFLTNVLRYIAAENKIPSGKFLEIAKSVFQKNAPEALYHDLLKTPEFPHEKQNLPGEILPEDLWNSVSDTFKKTKEVHAITYFLIHGKAPWWHENAGSKTIHELWNEQVISSSNKQLIAFIKRNILVKHVRKNILTLLHEPSLIDKIVHPNKEKNAEPAALWPAIKNKLSYRNYKILTEANLIFYFLRKDKRKEILWSELQKLFASYGINQNDFLKEVIQIHKDVPAAHSNGFFMMLHSSLAEGIVLNEIVPRGMPAKPSQTDLTHLPGAKHPEPDEIKDLSGDASPKRKTQNSYKSIRFLLDHLQTGFPELNKESIVELFKLVHQTTDPVEIRELYITLKNPNSYGRFIKLFHPSETEKVINYLFIQEYRMIKDYLYDLKAIFFSKTIRGKFKFSATVHLELTLLFLTRHYGKTLNMNDYTRFILKELFRNYEAYYEFSGLVRSGLLKKEFQLRTLLPTLLFSVTRQEKKKEKPKEKTDPLPEPLSEGVFIDNAGLILLWPYFSFYFQKLGLLEDNLFVSDEAAMRAANLLQYLVTGLEDNSEHQMYLNKILCNIPDHAPIEDRISLTPGEISLSGELLRTAISRWEIVKNTSIEGLRESFLKRAGKLEKDEEKFSLLVESKGYDVLLDSIPWNITVIKLPWMNKPIYTKWR